MVDSGVEAVVLAITMLDPFQGRCHGHLGRLLLVDYQAFEGHHVHPGLRLALVVVREEGERFHQLVALGHRDVAVVELFAVLALNVEPPVALGEWSGQRGCSLGTGRTS